MNAKDKILDNWQTNAAAWVQVLDADAIASRKLATNAAVIQAILDLQPTRVLDIGCGEGWLCRRLAQAGMQVTGIDGVASLIEHARQRSEGIEYVLADYQDLVQNDRLHSQEYDLMVCNFSLFDQDHTEALLSYLPRHLSTSGHLLIQTLHPDQQATDLREQSGWREERWAGLEDQFSGGYQWYYRSLPDWEQLFAENGLSLMTTQAVTHPETGVGLSVIFRLRSALT